MIHKLHRRIFLMEMMIRKVYDAQREPRKKSRVGQYGAHSTVWLVSRLTSPVVVECDTPYPRHTKLYISRNRARSVLACTERLTLTFQFGREICLWRRQ